MTRAETQLRQILDTRVNSEPFPEDPNARFEAVFAALGNSEAKCVTLLGMQPFPTTTRELHAQFLRDSGQVWKTGKELQANYCKASLGPIGLVARADTLSYGSLEYQIGWRVSEAGVKFGQPIAAFLVQQSAELPYSLGRIFGLTSTGNGESRSVINRVKILEYLYENEQNANNPTRVRDIGSNIENKVDTITAKHLVHLRELGLVEYSAIQANQDGQMRYKVADEVELRPGLKEMLPMLAIRVWEIMLELKSSSANGIFEKLKELYPDISNKPPAYLKRVRKALADLVRKGMLEKEEFKSYGNETGSVRSNTRITSDGKKIVEQIIIPIRRALTNEGEDLLASWRQIPWREYAAKVVTKHKEQSGNANSRPVAEVTSEILQLIQSEPGIRTGEIFKRIGTIPGLALGILIKDGLIRKERIGNASRYYPI